jgi:NAD-dependent SIR2 family protein deacetylase
MSIDPILPLSISIAEGNGTYAIFLGSGISSEAGIPTGSKLLDLTKEKLYIMNKSLLKIQNQDDYQKWIDQKEIKDMTYSDLLGMFNSEEDRRIFLEQFFVNAKPTESHRNIAAMVKNGLVKVIITTNFDRLMENALDEMKIIYDVVDCSHDLDVLKPREHSNCRIMKIHGDYKSLNIKNTEKELKQLEEKVEVEFQKILNNYGIIVAGYSGSDNGVMECFRKRSSKYTLYWLKRGNLGDNIKQLIDKQEGKIITVNSSDDFFVDLLNKVDFYLSYESGETPEYVMHMTKKYIRDYDEVSFRESLKKEIKILENNWLDLYYQLENGIREKDNESVRKVFVDFEKHMVSITAMGLILIEYSHDFIDYFFKQFQNIYELSTIIFEDNLDHSLTDNIIDIPKSAIYMLYSIIGAFCLKEENLATLGTLFTMELLVNDYNFIESKNIWETSIFYPHTFDRSPYKIFEYLIESYDTNDYLKEFFRSKTEFKVHICQFNLILCLYISKLIIELPSDDYGFNPNFSKYRNMKEKIKVPLLKCKINYPYLLEMSKVFNEDPNSFKDRYNERCEKINTLIKSYHDMGRFKLPLNLFNE